MTRSDDEVADARHLAALYAEIGSRLRRFGDRMDAASSVTRTALDLVPQAEHAGMTLVRPSRRLTTIGATSPLVDTIDAVQYELDTGPCVAAVVHERMLVAGDLPTDDRWPGFGVRAAELGVVSMASYRLALADRGGQDDVIGGLDLYAGQRDAFADPEVAATLATLATYAALAVWGGGLTEEVESLKSALAGSREIGMAQGIGARAVPGHPGRGLRAAGDRQPEQQPHAARHRRGAGADRGGAVAAVPDRARLSTGPAALSGRRAGGPHRPGSPPAPPGGSATPGPGPRAPGRRRRRRPTAGCRRAAR